MVQRHCQNKRGERTAAKKEVFGCRFVKFCCHVLFFLDFPNFGLVYIFLKNTICAFDDCLFLKESVGTEAYCTKYFLNNSV
jgi:hypothetical protein